MILDDILVKLRVGGISAKQGPDNQRLIGGRNVLEHFPIERRILSDVCSENLLDHGWAIRLIGQ